MTHISLELVLAFFLLAGVVLLILGLRGRRVDDHPVCRKCGFDLFGNPDSPTCSECGADLTRPRAVRTGHRRRIAWLITFAAFCLVASLGTITLRIVKATREMTVEQMKPAWWLVHDVRDTSRPFNAPVWAELTSRVQNGTISAARAADAADIALAVQADLNKTWNAAYGDYLDAMIATSTLSAERMQRYVRHGPQLSLASSPKVSPGRAFEVTFHLRSPRVGSKTDWVATYGLWTTIESDPRLPMPPRDDVIKGYNEIHWTLMKYTGGGGCTFSAGIGPTTLHAEVPIKVWKGSPHGPLLASWSLKADRPIEVVTEPTELPADEKNAIDLQR